MDVARTPLERIEDSGIHQLDDRRDIAVSSRQPVDGERFILVLFIANHIQREALGNFLEHALGLLGLLQQVGNL